MTASQPATPGSDSVRAQIAEALTRHFVLYGVDERAHCILCGWVGSSENLQSSVHLAEVLVPLVDRLRDEAKAEALEGFADWNDEDPDVRVSRAAVASVCRTRAEKYRDRAAAYRTDPSSEEQS